MMSHSSRIRELKRAGSTGKTTGSLNDGGASCAPPRAPSPTVRVGRAARGGEENSGMPAGDVVEQLKTAKREVANRDTTLKALQRNYETLAQVYEESKAEHQRRKTALDQLSDKYAEAQNKLDQNERKMMAQTDTITRLEQAKRSLESEIQRCRGDQEDKLKAKQEAFDQLNTLFAEQTQRLAHGDAQLRTLAGTVAELEAAKTAAAAAAKTAELKAQRLEARGEDTLSRLRGDIAALEAELQEVRDASKQQVEVVRRQMQQRNAEIEDMRTVAAARQEESSRLKEELAKVQAREATAASTCHEKDRQLQVVETELKQLRAQARKLATQLENSQSAEQEARTQCAAAEDRAGREHAAGETLRDELASWRAGYEELAAGMKREMSWAKDEIARREKEREEERRLLALDKEKIEAGLSDELRRARADAEMEVQSIAREREKAMEELAKVKIEKDSVREEGQRVVKRLEEDLIKDFDGVKQGLEDEVSRARALAAKFAAEREESMSKMQQAMRQMEDEHATEAKVAQTRVKMLQEALDLAQEQRAEAAKALQEEQARRQSVQANLDASEKASADTKSQRDLALAEKERFQLKNTELFSKIRDLEASQRVADAELSSTSEAKEALQAKLDELQSKMVLLHEASSSSQTELRGRLESLERENTELSQGMRTAVEERRERERENEQTIAANLQEFERDKARHQREIAKLTMDKEGLANQVAGLERQAEDAEKESQRLQDLLKAAELAVSASDTKCRELEAAVKGKEQELVLGEQERSGQVAALQDKLEKREAHLMRSEGIIRKLMADVDELKNK